MSGSRGRRIGVAIGFVIAVAAVVVAVVALGSDDGESPPDRATIAANRLCKTARQEIAEATRKHGDAFEEGNTNPLAQGMFDAVGKLQYKLGKLDVSEDKLEAAVELETRVYETEEAAILDLITVPPSKRILADADKLEAIESEIKSAASELGYDECERLSLKVPPLAS
jgi:hypothetical protein